MRITFFNAYVEKYSSKYAYDADDALASRMSEARACGFMTREDLIAVAEWKWRGGRTRQLAGDAATTATEAIGATETNAKATIETAGNIARGAVKAQARRRWSC